MTMCVFILELPLHRFALSGQNDVMEAPIPCSAAQSGHAIRSIGSAERERVALADYKDPSCLLYTSPSPRD